MNVMKCLVMANVAMCVWTTTCAQWNTGGAGQQYLSSPTRGVTLGTSSGVPPADLTVRGQEMSTPGIEQFRSIGSYNSGTSIELETNWRMFRLVNIGGTTREMGRLYAPSSADGSSFNVMAMEAGSSLWLRNPDLDGIRIRATGTPSMTYSSWTLDREGYAAIGTNGQITGVKPWARWHLVHKANSSNQEGWRPHMRNGTLATGNSDLAYFGQMFDMGSSGTGSEVNNNSNALIGWGSDGITAATNAWDNCTFRFYTNPNDGSAISAKSVRGLEIMRLRPYRSSSSTDIEGFVGIGDWASGSDLPTERLDILSGNVKIRALAQATDTRIVTADANGVLHWRPDAPDCEWSITSTASAPNHVYTGVGSSSTTCPDDADAVGIGVNFSSSPGGKLDIATDDFATAVNIVSSMSTTTTNGLKIASSGGTQWTKGLVCTAQQSSTSAATSIGLEATAYGAGTNGNNNLYGGLFAASGPTSRATGIYVSVDGGTNDSIGGDFFTFGEAGTVKGVVSVVQCSVLAGVPSSTAVLGSSVGDATANVAIDGVAQGTAPNSYTGVHGYAISEDVDATLRGGSFEAPTTDFSNSYAIAIYGDGIMTGVWSSSDAQLKENVEDLADGLEQILQLQPKAFNYRNDEFGFMNLPVGPQVGLIAQEVEPVFPTLVRTVHRPAEMDSVGSVVNPELDYKVLRYESLIPILISAVQEQNTTITDLQQQVGATSPDLVNAMQQQMQAMQEQLAAMQEQLAACCAGGMVPSGGERLEQSSGDGTVTGNARALLIQPNPFVDRTTLTYTLDHAGRMQLMANSADGKQLRVLSEASLEAGQYTYEWSTTDLAPGVYYVTLLLDSEPLVKKAVRVKE